VPEERDQIASQLRSWCDVGNGGESIDVVLTTGGTGIALRDVTPEATLDIADRVVPGIAEAMRTEGLRHTQRAMLSRAVAAVRRTTLIVNFPGSERGVRESLGAIIDVLPHAADLLRGDTEHK
jgi:molybdenum cofactor synthesis domain-containing protein